MDPLSFISFAGHILQLLSCGKDMVELAREIHRSPAGATKSNEGAASFVKRSQSLSQAVRIDKPISQLTDNEKQLCNAAVDCESICLELEIELLKLSRGDGKRSVFNSWYLAVRSWFTRDKIKELNERLARCEGQISAHLLCLIQSDFKDAFAQFLVTSEDSRAHTAAVREGMDALRQGLMVSGLEEAALRQLKELLEISEGGDIRRRQNQILSALQFRKMNDRYAGVCDAHERTFNWIFDEQGPVCDPSAISYPDHKNGIEDRNGYSHRLRLEARDQFVKWLEADSKSPQDAVFHILGKPGAGKSTLMKYISRHENTRVHLQRWSGDKELVLGAFFFWRPGSDPQKSQRGLVRALLYSILSEAPDLIPTAFPTHWLDVQKSNATLVALKQHEIEDAFNTVIRHPRTYTGYRFAFFLDGLDEFEDKLHHNTKQQLVSLILSWVRDSNGRIKIIASSRHHVEFENGFERSPGIRLQDLTRSDMETVVAGRLAEIQTVAGHIGVDSFTLWSIKSRILGKSNGVFLWVSLVLKSVEAGILQGDSWRVLEQKIDTLPEELEDLLQRMFDEIHPSDKTKALQTFLTALNIGEILSDFHLWMYTFWDEVVLDPVFVSKQPLSTATQEEIEIGLTKCKRQVYGVCRGLLDVVGQGNRLIVVFTHRSAIDFLNKPKISDQIYKPTKPFNFQETIRQCCLAYVKMVTVPENVDEVVSDMIQTRLDRHDPSKYHFSFKSEDAWHFYDFLDQLMQCIEGRERYQIAFFEANEASASGGEEAPAKSPAVRIAERIIASNSLAGYVSRNKRSFSKIINVLHVMPSVQYIVPEYMRGQRWLEMLQTILDGKTVSPSRASIYLAETVGFFLSTWTIAIWNCLDGNQSRFLIKLTSHCKGENHLIAAAFLAYILLGGDTGMTIRIEPDTVKFTKTFYFQGMLVTNIYSAKLSVMVRLLRTFFPSASQGGPAQIIRFQDLVDMLSCGQMRKKLHEMLDERNKYPDLDDWQASLRVQDTLGTPVQIWRECLHSLERENSYLHEDKERLWKYFTGQDGKRPDWWPNEPPIDPDLLVY